MKNNQIVTLVLLLSGLPACGGGLTSDQIKESLQDAGVVSSSLNYKIGEKWEGTQTEVVKTAPYKYEGGTSTPCDPFKYGSSATDCGKPRGDISTITTTVKAEVLGKSDVSALELPGYIVKETQHRIVDMQDYYPVDNTQGVANLKQEFHTTVLYTLAEYNGFVVRVEGGLQEGADITKGVALYPVSPSKGDTYTDDSGMTWTAVGTSKVTAGSLTLGAVDVTAATNPVDLQTLDIIKSKCFLRGTNSINLKSGCDETFTTKHSVRVSIALDLGLILTAHVETIDLINGSWGIRDSVGGWVDGSPAASATGETVFAYTQEIRDSTFTITSLTLK